MKIEEYRKLVFLRKLPLEMLLSPFT